MKKTASTVAVGEIDNRIRLEKIEIINGRIKMRFYVQI